jgi:hypothetical protein
MIRRNGNEENAASRLPRNNCQVPKPVTARVKRIIKIAAGLLIAG